MKVFNQQVFNDTRDFRFGSDNDVKLLEQAFESFNVKPHVHHNYTLGEIATEMKLCSWFDYFV